MNEENHVLEGKKERENAWKKERSKKERRQERRREGGEECKERKKAKKWECKIETVRGKNQVTFFTFYLENKIYAQLYL